MKKFKFDINYPGEPAAGLRSFSEEVLIIVRYDPGGDKDGEDSFQEYMKGCLRDWFDGAGVSTQTMDDKADQDAEKLWQLIGR